MQADRTRQQTPPAPAADHAPVVRGANTIDRYSLTLQLIQVYPIILGAVAVVLPIKWLRILVAVLGLLVGTLWVIVRERVTEGSSPGRPDDTVPPNPALDRLLDQIPASQIPVRTTSGVHGIIRVEVWVHPEGADPPARRRHRTYQRSVPRGHRTGSIPPSRRHPKTAADPEPSDGSGHRTSLQPRVRARG